MRGGGCGVGGLEAEAWVGLDGLHLEEEEEGESGRYGNLVFESVRLLVPDVSVSSFDSGWRFHTGTERVLARWMHPLASRGATCHTPGLAHKLAWGGLCCSRTCPCCTATLAFGLHHPSVFGLDVRFIHGVVLSSHGFTTPFRVCFVYRLRYLAVGTWPSKPASPLFSPGYS